MADFKQSVNRVIHGDALTILPQLPEESVNTIVTSPPYFGHRVYSTDTVDPHEIGRENDVSGYVARLVQVFDQAKRVLRKDGTLWLNLGDTYRDGAQLGVPWRVAFALVDAGWILRTDIIWHKTNAMPSSVKTRPTIDHEYLFLLSKSANYHYDADAIREPHVTLSPQSKMRGGRNHFGKQGGTPEEGKNAGNSNLHDARWDQAFHPKGRNKRTVWSLPLGKFRDAHFAVFPESLIEPCIKAGCPDSGIVLDPFTGSGTTGIVAQRLGRKFVGIELVKKYRDMAQERIVHAHESVGTFFDLDARKRGPGAATG